MGKKIIMVLLAVTLLFSITACGPSKKEKEEAAEKARQEELQKQNEAAANAVVSAIEGLPEKLKLENETEVAGARELYDALTDEQKALVPQEMVTKLEEAEKTIEEHRQIKEERDKKKAENKEAANKAEGIIDGIPDKVTLDTENAVLQARAAYNELTDDQKKFVSKDKVEKLTSAEKKIKELKEEKAKKEEEAKKKAEKKKAEKEKKKSEPKTDKYAIAKKYIGKKATALISAIGKPKRTKENPNCATDGQEFIYYYDGFYVGVLSQDMDSPLIVQTVKKN